MWLRKLAVHSAGGDGTSRAHTHAAVSRLQAGSSSPPPLRRPLRRHGSLPLTPWHESIMGMTALQTADLLIAPSDDLVAAPGEQQHSAPDERRPIPAI